MTHKQIFIFGILGCAFLMVLFSEVSILEADVIENPPNPAELPTGTGVVEEGSLYGLIGQIINWVLGFLGVLLLGIILFSGFEYATAGADSQKTGNALKRMANAVIGLLIIALSWVISGTILNFFFTEEGLQSSVYPEDSYVITESINRDI